MPQSGSVFSRDGNHVPITKPGLSISTSITLVTGNSAHYFPLFSVTGTVEIMTLYGVITTVLGSNVTAASFRTWDQTAAVPISAAAGTTLSNLPVGSLISRTSIASVALTASDSTAAKVQDPVAATAPDCFMPFMVVQKTGSITTDIEFVETTNNGSLGSIQFFCGFVPVSADGNVTVSPSSVH
jgi:hypothetical protein